MPKVIDSMGQIVGAEVVPRARSAGYNLMASTTLLGPLKRIWFAPQMFEAMLLVATIATRPRLFARLRRLECAVRGWPDVTTQSHRYGGLEFRIGKREIGHVHANGIVDIPLSRHVAERLIAGERVMAHHTNPKSGWVTIDLQSDIDTDIAISVMRMAYDRGAHSEPAPPEH